MFLLKSKKSVFKIIIIILIIIIIIIITDKASKMMYSDVYQYFYILCFMH